MLRFTAHAVWAAVPLVKETTMNFPFPTRSTVMSPLTVHLFVRAAVGRSLWFAVMPLPDDLFEVHVKAEHEALLVLLQDALDTSRAETLYEVASTLGWSLLASREETDDPEQPGLYAPEWEDSHERRQAVLNACELLDVALAGRDDADWMIATEQLGVQLADLFTRGGGEDQIDELVARAVKAATSLN